MSLVWKRNYWIILALVASIGIALVCGSLRIIAYHFGESGFIEAEKSGYENSVALFDASVVHDVSIGLTAEEYDSMVTTYQETGEKDYYRTSVTIDGVTIDDVGVRLKGNLTLRQTLGGSGSEQGGGMGAAPIGDIPADVMQGGPQGRMGFNIDMIDLENLQLPPFITLPEDWDTLSDEEKRSTLQTLFASMHPGGAQGGQENVGQLAGGGMVSSTGGNPPFLIKFDEFVDGQSYEGVTELAVRIGSDVSLLSEPVAFAIHDAAGQIVPESSYGVVTMADNEPSLYVLTENLDESYIEKYFGSSDGVLYKAGNFVGFSYLGDDPTLYANSYEQVTNVGDDDLAPLIEFLKFLDESSDEVFAQDLDSWIDVDSLIRMMALDTLLQNQDSFSGMGSNYYLYYNKETKQFTMLSWDQNLALGGLGGGNRMQTNTQDDLGNVVNEWMNEGGFNGADANAGVVKENRGGGMSGKTNTLKERLFANEKFKAQYDAEYTRLSSLIFGDNGIGESMAQSFIDTFLDYNTEHSIMDSATYTSAAQKILSFFGTAQE
ncbi:MAG: CotH kinase family protein [Patescibacteria group bacterium]|jgi:spore coat protein CotH